MKMNRSGKCESEILLIFFFSVANPRTYAVGSELLNLGKVLLRGIIFYIVCAGVGVHVHVSGGLSTFLYPLVHKVYIYKFFFPNYSGRKQDALLFQP